MNTIDDDRLLTEIIIIDAIDYFGKVATIKTYIVVILFEDKYIHPNDGTLEISWEF